MNRVIIIGNLTNDAEVRITPNDIKACRFTVAVKRRFSKENETDFIPVTAWRAQAEACGKYLKKGSKVAVTGSVQIRTYDKKGERRYATEIVADEVEFLSTAVKAEDFEAVEETAELPF